MRTSLGLAAARVVVLHNFAPPVTGEPDPLPERPRLLFAGRLSREKGVDVLLRALPRVAAAHPEVELVVAGDGPERLRLEELARDLGVAKRVCFTGRLAPGQLDQVYRAATLCVLPTLWMENCPVVVLEAFAHGRGVVATRIGGVPELVTEDVNGALFRRGGDAELAEKLSTLMGDRDLCTRLGRRAHDLARSALSLDVHLRRLEATYRDMIGAVVRRAR
jgi:glycosyltransferase involved in cell wall biosynthesis